MNEGNKPKSHSVYTDDSNRSSEVSNIQVQPTPSKI